MSEVDQKIERMKDDLGVIVFKGSTYFFGQQVCRYLDLVARSGGRSVGFNAYYKRLRESDRIRMPGYDHDDNPKLSPVLITERGVRRLIEIAEKRRKRKGASHEPASLGSSALSA